MKKEHEVLVIPFHERLKGGHSQLAHLNRKLLEEFAGNALPRDHGMNAYCVQICGGLGYSKFAGIELPHYEADQFAIELRDEGCVDPSALRGLSKVIIVILGP